MAKKPRKKKSKKKKSGQRISNIPPIALLRSRLDTIFSSNNIQVTSDLQPLLKGVAREDFISILLSAYHNALPESQSVLDRDLPQWLEQSDLISTLLTMIQQQLIKGADRERAQIWLQGTGIDISSLQIQRPTSFCEAYVHKNEFQGMVVCFWFTDPSRKKIRGLGFLIDFHAPWYGALKDLLVLPKRSPRFIPDFLQKTEFPMEQITREHAKEEIWESLDASRKNDRRLPRDMINYQDIFFECVCVLMDTLEAPKIMTEQFEYLSKTGDSPEEIRNLEQPFIFGDFFDDE